MHLQRVGLRGRRFAIQFGAIDHEFGRTIPWLAGLDTLTWSTNAAFFDEALTEMLGQPEGGITPYQFVQNSRPKEFVGGVIRLAVSPERFKDKRNARTAENLADRGASFISCLQVRPEHRQQDHGHELMRRALNAILAENPSVWGVVSEPRLVPWYQSLGATMRSPENNRDDLWIVHWQTPATPNT